ncbi:MAG: Rpn family recombination-promoting nuclease/putative transposase [Desulfuromonadaceae bacterium]
MKERLVRFDWAMKKLLRNKANFEILEGFLSVLIRQDVTIKNILESESNKQSGDDKYNRVDLLTEIESGELVLIELQVGGQYDYFHRMLYGSSKLITDHMDSGFSYDKVRKVVSINIVYFDLGHGEDYVYKGLTDFRGIHKNDLLKLSTLQMETLSNLEHVSEIFPEYYILKVNGFNDRAEDSLDEWIYFLKNSEIKKEFNAKGLQKAALELDILKLSKADREDYESYIEDQRVVESSIRSSWAEGEMKGKIEGKIERNGEIAIEMIRDGEANEKISKYTGLSVSEIETVRGEIERGM